MESNKGNKVANQFIIELDNLGRYFQSYNSIIANIRQGVVTLDEYYWNYSRTTSKYLSQFLGISNKEIKEKVARREYILTNLN